MLNHGKCNKKCQGFSWAKINTWARKRGFLSTLFPNVEPIYLKDPSKKESSLGCGRWQPILWEKEVRHFVELGVNESVAQAATKRIAALGFQIQVRRGIQ